MKYGYLLLPLALTLVAGPFAEAQRVPKKAVQVVETPSAEDKEKEAKPWSATTFKGLEFRSIGPAFYAGRIADAAINPNKPSEFYVAVGSGGVWKTSNGGVTFKSLFDKQNTYSIGTVVIDPHNDQRIWVGTGENSGGRHFAWGDGLYLSDDGGETWTNKGLKRSEHISKVIVHPNPDSANVMWVAAQGPLWSKGGERGLYMSTDGGDSWTKTLGNDEWTGATDLLLDPNDPSRLYCATWDRHRTVAAYMGGGPGSGIHASSDGGRTWTKLSTGLPKGVMGKIGLAMSPQDPDVLYAAIELELRTGGVWRSENRGASWTKMSDLIAGGTGPHYYQELYASPHAFDRLYFSNNVLQVSEDGGKTWRSGEAPGKHVDNHVVTFRADDPNYLMVGTDGGLYESYDLGKTYRHFPMPITQFYKIAVDDAEPFYNIYGGTQDNSTQGGPSRSDNTTGVQSGNWEIVNGGDGHQPATEPGNPDIFYAQSQQGYLNRIDRATGEHVVIRPQPAAGEPYERYNWDAPIWVSQHDPKRLYFASQRLWRSDDRGDNWTALSKDLTRDENRLALPIMGRVQSYDNPWDVYAMSNFNSITSIGESAVDEKRLYVGTDDGLIWTSADGGTNWTKTEVGSLPGVPKRAFVNDIRGDLHDANTAYVCMDNHKEGDYRPFLYKTTDGGANWRPIMTGLPDTTLVWRTVQDHVNPKLLFVGTEFGVYFSVDGGGEWLQLQGGLPPIGIRDLKIQQRENDLVAASFGRSIYILDDYSALRSVDKAMVAQPAALLPMREVDLYQPRSILTDGGVGSIGTDNYVAKNPQFGAVITYYLRDEFTSAEDLRKEKEKAFNKANSNVIFPGYDALELERLEQAPKLWLTIADAQGNTVRRLEASGKKGVHRQAWNLRYPSMMPVEDKKPSRGDDDDDNEEDISQGPNGRWAEPGTYSVTLSKQEGATWTTMAGPMSFEVKRLHEGSLSAKPAAERIAFAKNYEQARATYQLQTKRVAELEKDMKRAMDAVLRAEEKDISAATKTLDALGKDLAKLKVDLNGAPSRTKIGEKTNPSVGSRLGETRRGSGEIFGPTGTSMANLDLINTELATVDKEITRLESLLTGVKNMTRGWNMPSWYDDGVTVGRE